MALVIGIFAGKAKTIEQGDTLIRTAINKQAQFGPVEVALNGLVGDERANHDNAIYGVCSQSYAYWQAQLQLENPWPLGWLGENLLLSGIDEQAVAIGDLFRIGSVLLRVSGCRTPCKTLLWKTGLKVDFLQQFQRSNHTGFYFEVLQVGEICQGDEVQYIPCGHKSIAVAELAAVLAESSIDKELRDRLLSLPGMGRQMIRQLMAMTVSNWKKAEVTDIFDESSDVKSFFLNLEGDRFWSFQPGQFLTIGLMLEGKTHWIRCWSISNFDTAQKTYRISIKRKSGGIASTYMHDHIKVGDRLDILPPSGNFCLPHIQDETPIVLISAGVGITPMISMLHAYQSRSKLVFIHSTTTRAACAFRHEVDEIAKDNALITSHFIYSKEGDGRLNKARLSKILADLSQWTSTDLGFSHRLHGHFYLCGPTGFIADMSAALKSLGADELSIFTESFVAEANKDSSHLPKAKVKFEATGKTADWLPEDNLSLLALAEFQGLNPVFSCRSGRCGLCSSALIKGEVEYDKPPEFEIAEGQVLLCCARPNGPVTLDIAP